MLLEILKALETSITNRDREGFMQISQVAYKFLAPAFTDNHLEAKNIDDAPDAIIANQNDSRRPEYQDLQEVLKICQVDAKMNNLFLIFLQLANNYKDRNADARDRNSIHRLAFAYRNNYLPLNYSKDFELFDLSFLQEREVSQSILGKPLKSGKEYPQINSGNLVSMRIDRWENDEYIPYLTTEEKKLFKVRKYDDHLARKIDIEKGNKLMGEYIYLVSEGWLVCRISSK